MSGIRVHLIDLVSLPQAIPCPEIGWIGVNRGPVALNGCACIFHFQVLVAHQSPCRYELFVKLDGPHEIQSTFLVVSSKTVIVSDDATRLGPIFVVLEYVERQLSKFSIVLLDIQNIGV